jgi:hypothetical protein
MIDKYTKAVLSVIAVALAAIAVQGTIPKAKAGLDDCGTVQNPWHIQITGWPGYPLHMIGRAR